ncbi:hypothetical protein WR25_21119 [Diploscapter pachys]|uniref:Uncharacterized protein n=1 Tax=Diploscapter pachys TaxID=2018661 RepID=A0A2A2JS57_9BILA|nr:hypothetical protein WR25_21119 [Diploscapter pachys]
MRLMDTNAYEKLLEKGRNRLKMGDLKTMKVNGFYQTDDFKQKNGSKAFTTLFSQTWTRMVEQPRYYCLDEDCIFANYDRATMLSHCRKMHKQDADCFEDRIEDWKQDDVKSVPRAFWKPY